MGDSEDSGFNFPVKTNPWKPLTSISYVYHVSMKNQSTGGFQPYRFSSFQHRFANVKSVNKRQDVVRADREEFQMVPARHPSRERLGTLEKD